TARVVTGLNGQKGINTNELYGLSSTQLQARVAAYKTLGVKWARFDFDWSVIQPNGPSTYNFAPFDAVVKALAGARITILCIIDYKPSWGNGGKPSKY